MNPQEKYLSENNKFLYDAIMDKHLWFVHSTNIMNEMTKRSLEQYGTESYSEPEQYDKTFLFRLQLRPILHHSINSLVTPFTNAWTWDCRPYIFVAPLSEFIGELYEGVEQDFLTLGSHHYSNESFLLVPEKERRQIQKEFPGIESTIVGYDYDEEIRDKEGVECMNYLGSLRPPIYANSIAESKTPREAINNLFNYLRERREIDTWKFPNVYQYVEKGVSKIPKAVASSSIRNELGIRINQKGYLHDVNRLLSQTFNKIVADDALLITENREKKLYQDLQDIIFQRGETKSIFKFIENILALPDPNSIQPPIFEGNVTNPLCIPIRSELSRLLDITKGKKELVYDLNKGKYKPEIKTQIEIIFAKLEDYISVILLCQRLLEKYPDDLEKLQTLYRGYDSVHNNVPFIYIFMRILYKDENRSLLKSMPDIFGDIEAKCYLIHATPLFIKKVKDFGSKMRGFLDRFDGIVDQLHAMINAPEIEPLSEAERNAIQNHPMDKIQPPPARELSRAERRILAQREAARAAREAAEAAAAAVIGPRPENMNRENSGFGAIQTNLFGGRKRRQTRKKKINRKMKKSTRKH